MSQGGTTAALWSLAAGNLAVGTGSLVLAGMLPGMALDLERTEAATGQALTAYAIAVAFGGPLLAGPTSRLDRRFLLFAALLLLAVANAVAAFAPDLEWLIGARVLAGLCASVTTPVAAATAAMIVPADKRGQAMGFVFAGFTAAAVIGIPLGALAAGSFGWRATLEGVSALALIAAIAVLAWAPRGLRGAPIDGVAWKELMRSPRLFAIILVTALQALGQFMLFTYIAPALADQIGADARMVSLMFFVCGAAGLVGTLAASRFIDRFGPPVMVQLMIFLAQAAFLLWPAGQNSFAVTAALIGLWGVASFTINGATQAWLMFEAPHLAKATLPLNTSAIYVGQAFGAALGGLALAKLGSYWLAPIGGVILAVALSLSILVAAHAPRRAERRRERA
ncbi:MFS transporter [Terrarubrum flagellatum]|uniref:MFS transporter n=1 Tax=Terrirubrum flagellatum TaxID=2895980 RepID=UPI0031452675